MSTIVNLERIKEILPEINVVEIIEVGFAAYSRGEVVVPPVGELIFEDPPGEAHIKYGYIKGDDFFVIKIASGFYHNPKLGVPSNQGLMLLFCQNTGSLKAILLDDGYLTAIRTAAAGAVAARHLAPEPVKRIGILGSGTQGKLQVQYLREITPCREVSVWVPDAAETEDYLAFFAGSDWVIEIANDPAQVAAECNLIVTTTPSTKPLLLREQIRPGTHITAVGSDVAQKIELDPEILGNADLVVVDSISQSESRGEVFRAFDAGALRREHIVELGTIIADTNRKHRQAGDITVCDLTGVAVQDLQIAKAVFLKAGQANGALS